MEEAEFNESERNRIDHPAFVTVLNCAKRTERGLSSDWPTNILFIMERSQ